MFINTLHVKEAGSKKWRLTKPLTFANQNNNRVFTVPANFETDLASVPWFARWLLPQHGRYTKAAVIHDCMIFDGYDRRLSDLTFNDAMKACEVKTWRRVLLYSGVYIYTTFLKLFGRA